jgi:hypothetical protein
MSQIYLAIDYGYEGWNLTPYDSSNEALEVTKEGTYGKWKILREVSVGERVDWKNG